jgi:hypothetical protein
MMRTFDKRGPGRKTVDTPADTWSYIQVETALCLWEAICDLRTIGFDKNKAGEDPGETYLKLEQLFDGAGSYTMRAAVASIVDECDVAWEVATALHGGDYPDSFDFDFCPAFISGAIDSGLLGRAVDAQYGSHEPVPAKAA